jgi:Zn-dependent peptidase ImmA (M78 family)
MKVKCCGDRLYTKELAENLTKVIEDLQSRFPKFAQHLKKLKGISVHDDFSDTDFAQSKTAMGIYNNYSREIHIASNHAYTNELAIYTLFHEIGHHLVNIKLGIDQYYNSTSKNRAYFKEEIRAEKYALFIIDNFFVKDYPIMLRFLSLFNRFHRIKSDIISTINEYKVSIEKCPKPAPRYYISNSFSVSGTTTSTATYTIISTSTTGTRTGTITGLYNKL